MPQTIDVKRVAMLFQGEARTPGGCEIYRGNMPLHFLAQSKRWIAAWDWIHTIQSDYHRYGPEAWIRFVVGFDVFVFPRLYAPTEEALAGIGYFFNMLRDMGKRIIYEVDDDFTNRHRHVVEGDAMTPMSWADAVTVTTPYLAKLMREFTDRPIHVLPNCIDPADWRDGNVPKPAELRDKVVIGLTGSVTHYADWRVLRDVLPQVLAQNPKAHLLLMGFHPDYLRHNLTSDNYTLLPWENYSKYTQTIRMCDIILAPVDHDGFNLGKSPLKVIEGMAARRKLQDGRMAGAATIATKHPVYELAINGKNGLLVEQTPEAWHEAIQRLIDRRDLRESLQVKGHSWVYQRHDITQEWRKWDAAYRQVLNTPPNNCPLPVPTFP